MSRQEACWSQTLMCSVKFLSVSCFWNAHTHKALLLLLEAHLRKCKFLVVTLQIWRMRSLTRVFQPRPQSAAHLPMSMLSRLCELTNGIVTSRAYTGQLRCVNERRAVIPLPKSFPPRRPLVERLASRGRDVQEKTKADKWTRTRKPICYPREQGGRCLVYPCLFQLALHDFCRTQRYYQAPLIRPQNEAQPLRYIAWLCSF